MINKFCTSNHRKLMEGMSIHITAVTESVNTTSSCENDELLNPAWFRFRLKNFQVWFLHHLNIRPSGSILPHPFFGAFFCTLQSFDMEILWQYHLPIQENYHWYFESWETNKFCVSQPMNYELVAPIVLSSNLYLYISLRSFSYGHLFG